MEVQVPKLWRYELLLTTRPLPMAPSSETNGWDLMSPPCCSTGGILKPHCGYIRDGMSSSSQLDVRHLIPYSRFGLGIVSLHTFHGCIWYIILVLDALSSGIGVTPPRLYLPWKQGCTFWLVCTFYFPWCLGCGFCLIGHFGLFVEVNAVFLSFSLHEYVYVRNLLARAHSQREG